MYFPSRLRLFLALVVAVILVAGEGAALSTPAYSVKGEVGHKHKVGKAKIRDGEAVPKQILLRVNPGVSPESMKKLHLKAGARPISSIYKLGVTRVSLGNVDIDDALRVYRSSHLIEFAEPNYRRKAAEYYPNDPLYPEQWGLIKIGTEKAWEYDDSTLSTVKVAVLDTGIDLNHDDLKDALARDPSNPDKVLGKHFYTDSYDRQASDDNIQDDTGHGTHISGIIAGRTNNGIGIAGIAPAARIMPVKILDHAGFGDDASIAEGLIWAIDNGARVINMSLAGPTPSNTLASAIEYAIGKGAVIVAATGNNGTGELSYPAAYEGVIGVGAVDATDAWMQKSNFGPYVDVVAPGISILSTFLASKSNDGQPYEWANGTSMAAGFVSGLAAMIFSINPKLTNDQVKGILFVTAEDLGLVGWDRYYGFGRIDASRAVTVGPDNNRPTIAITSPADGVKLSGSTLTVSASAGDAEGSIAFVEFFLNGMRIGTDTSPPYIYNINVSGLYGKNIIRAVAYDSSGNSRSAEIGCYKQTFADVGISHWAFQDVEMLAADKVVSGYPDGAFKPDNPVERAEFVKMIIEGLGLPKKLHYNSYFKDVPITHWAWPYIESAYELGMITGYSDNKFLPGNRIKRVEMTSILMRSGIFPVNYSGEAFADVPISHWGYGYIMSARNAGIINGYPGNYFRPDQAMSRAESAKVIKNSLY